MASITKVRGARMGRLLMGAGWGIFLAVSMFAGMVDGQAIPARPTQWAWIPAKWLDNEFRKIKGGSAP